MTDNPDLRCGRGWLARASDVLTGAEEYTSPGDYARTAAIIGSGFVALAHAERAAASSATLDAAAERVRRAAAEARPHDDDDLFLRVEDALSWIDDPKDATPEQQLTKIRELLDGPRAVDRG